MRRIAREELELNTIKALQDFQDEVDSHAGFDLLHPGRHWNGKRNSQHVHAVYTILKRMAGTRERCMYCVDSEGTDIEHFWPKSLHPNRMYVWLNLLLACAQCGRLKGVQFPLTIEGTPLLIDPSVEDPWQFLDFDPLTGNLNARYLLQVERYSEKGETTVKVLHLDKREGISAGYRKTYDRLCTLVTGWADAELPVDYLDRLRQADEHGLIGWFIHGSGTNEPCFSRFRALYPDAWTICCKALS